MNSIAQILAPQGFTGFGSALQTASPFLLGMAQGIREGDPWGGAYAGFAEMDRRAQMEEEKRRKEAEAARQAAEASMFQDSLAAMLRPDVMPTYGAPVATNDAEAVANDTMTALGFQPSAGVTLPHGAQPTPEQRALVVQAAREAGVPPDLFMRLVAQESAFRPEVWSGTQRSTAGAIGPAQLMPGTAAELGVDPLDPYQNLLGGARYLRQQLDAFQDPRLALAAYNAGPGRVREAGGVPAIAETRDYVAAIMGQPTPGPRVSPDRAAAILASPNAPAALKEMVLAQFSGPAEPAFRRTTPEEDAMYGGPGQIDTKTGRYYPLQTGPDTVINSGQPFGSKVWEDRYEKIQDAAASGLSALSMLDTLEDAFATGVRTGFGAETEQAMRRAASALGFEIDPEQAAAAQVITAVQNQMSLLMRSPDSGMGMPGAVSDKDLAFLRAAQPGLDKTPEANRKMIATLRAAERRKLEIAQLADEYIARNGRLDSGFNEVVRQYAEQRSMFTDAERAFLNSGSQGPGAAPAQPATAAPPAGAAAIPPRDANGRFILTDPSQMGALPSGTEFVAPDGTIRRVP